jgi:carbamoyl-phosphate synthase large subunit
VTKKVLVPGAGYGQVQVIRAARRLGHHVIVVSPHGDYPGFAEADTIYHEDVRDAEAVLGIARRERIDAIVSDQNDIPVETIGYVAEQLGLPGNDHATSRLFTHKDLMRARCQVLGVPCLEYGVATSADEAVSHAQRVGFPVMCKPVDSQSSKGVFRASDAAALTAGFAHSLRCSFSGRVIVERFVAGAEYCVEGLAIQGRFENLLALERTYFHHDSVFVPSMTTAPTGLDDDALEELLKTNTRVCEGFGLQTGLSHSEFIRDPEDGRFYLLETAARGGGVFISSHLVPFACRLDTQELLVRLALGQVPERIHDGAPKRAVRYACFYLSSGTIVDVRGVDAVRALDGVLHFYDAGLTVGSRAGGLVDKSSRLGPILMGADSPEEITALTQRMHDTLVVETDTAANAVVWE